MQTGLETKWYITDGTTSILKDGKPEVQPDPDGIRKLFIIVTHPLGPIQMDAIEAEVASAMRIIRLNFDEGNLK